MVFESLMQLSLSFLCLHGLHGLNSLGVFSFDSFKLDLLALNDVANLGAAFSQGLLLALYVFKGFVHWLLNKVACTSFNEHAVILTENAWHIKA